MGRGKQRRKYKQKKKRMEKAKRGKLVRFDLQNSGRKYSGFRDKYCYQTNIHRLIYKDAKFQNVKFQTVQHILQVVACNNPLYLICQVAPFVLGIYSPALP